MSNSKKGKVWVYGDNVDTDVIIPARYLNSTDAKELASHCMEDIDQEFVGKVQQGDIIVAGENFGCGSSREHAPIAIKECGISAVIAKSFARIFFRNAINIGLTIIENPDLPDETEAGDEIEIDVTNGQVKNLTKNKVYSINPLPPSIQELIAVGGLINYTKDKLGIKS
ncbi:MAG TPA: 3-isopropylmalate dehydratase small subunit [Candidatus Gastranaerophilales bacterium]|nr:3-isopropylmalate dehydratase small subunit [Candidatus Gastranaerophilales bacterium]